MIQIVHYKREDSKKIEEKTWLDGVLSQFFSSG